MNLLYMIFAHFYLALRRWVRKQPEMSEEARESEKKQFGFTKVRFIRTFNEFEKTFKALRKSGDQDKFMIVKMYKAKLDKIVCFAVFAETHEEIMDPMIKLHELSVQLHLELEFLQLARERDMASTAKKA